MNTDSKFYKSIALLVLATAALLMIPLIAMQFTNEVVWELGDFIFAGALLFGTGLTYKLVTRKSRKIAYRIAIGFTLFTGLFLVWTEAAVGIIGRPGGLTGWMELGVLAVGIIGTVIARLQPYGMVRALLVTAFAQGLVGVIALIVGLGTATNPWYHMLGTTGFFTSLFVISAILFWHAAQHSPSNTTTNNSRKSS